MTARREARALGDGDIATACQQSCPAQAIVFGDSNDPQSRLSAAAHDRRAYRLLGELNIGPQVTYLAQVKNRGGERG